MKIRLFKLLFGGGKPKYDPSDVLHWHIGGGWGNAINWQRYPNEVVGWKLQLPRAGDILFSKMESGRTGVWRFTNVKPCYDPRDMFFASVEPLGYEDEIEVPPETGERSPYFL